MLKLIKKKITSLLYYLGVCEIVTAIAVKSCDSLQVNNLEKSQTWYIWYGLTATDQTEVHFALFCEKKNGAIRAVLLTKTLPNYPFPVPTLSLPNTYSCM